MFWYKFTSMSKMSFLFIGLVLASCLLLSSSCGNSKDANASVQSSDYYAIQSFFQQEVDSLKRINPMVYKTVGKDADQESKSMHIKDWNAEFGAFLSVDLSKPAYAGMYDVDSTAQQITYTAKSEDVDVQSMSINFDQAGQVVSVEIVRSEDNFLYQNSEQLSYLRGVEYTMSKQQHILLLGTSHYQIVGNLTTK